ncbi:MAG: M56 family metallopeptidase [Chloroflexota bacterium]
MNKSQKLSNQGFYQILGIGCVWLLISIGFTGRYLPDVIEAIYQICQSSWATLIQHVSMNRHLLLPMIIMIILGRGLYLLLSRLWKTYHFSKTLRLKRTATPQRVIRLAKMIQIDPQNIICIQTDTVRAFSLGIRHPKIWLSTGLINLLDDDELMAVLHHEAHHCQQFDPLRLLIARLTSDIFFFIPRINSLVDHHHLAQEMAADAAAVESLGDNLPLASALHKLLTHPKEETPIPNLAISQLNITERRILALVSSHPEFGWQSAFFNWGGALLLAAILFGLQFLTDPVFQQTIVPCTS